MNLDDGALFVPVLDLSVPWARTWADPRPGKTDKDRREQLRTIAAKHFRAESIDVQWWAFRISVRKKGKGRFDVENVAKTIIDAFCSKQIVDDQSAFPALGLYSDDTIDHVRVVQLIGERAEAEDSTRIEIFARRA